MSGPQGDPHDDLHQIQLKTNQVVDSSLESTRRMLQLCEESEDAGAKTLTMLNHQGGILFTFFIYFATCFVCILINVLCNQCSNN